MSITKTRAIGSVAVDQIIVTIWHYFLEEIQLQKKCLPATVINMTGAIIDPVPGVVREPSNRFAKLGANDGQSIRGVVALLVE